MNCHHTGTKRNRTWLVVLLVALAVVAWAVWGKRALFTMSPFFIMMLICPLMHGAMFFFMGKSMRQEPQHQQNPSHQGEIEAEN